MKYKILALLFGLSLCFLFEVGLGFLNKKTHLDSILKILEADSTLFWKQRQNLSTVFFGKPIRTDANGFRVHPSFHSDGAKEILILGASPSFGWGVEEDSTYPALLEKETKMKVVNASTVGYSSHQGLRLTHRLIEKIDYSWVIISYVTNDIDTKRFFFSSAVEDKALVTPGPWIVKLYNLLSDLNFFSVVQKLAQKQRNTPETLPPALPRVSTKDYEANLTALGEIAQKSGAQPIFLLLPVEIPITSPHSTLAEALSLTERGLIYNNLMRSVAKKLNAPLIDAGYEFLKFKNEYFYLDPKGDTIHPNARGHSVIANAILNVLSK